MCVTIGQASITQYRSRSSLKKTAKTNFAAEMRLREAKVCNTPESLQMVYNNREGDKLVRNGYAVV